jgi:8-oxo-dGTP diphosphatase
MCTPSLAIDAIIEVLPEGGSIDDMKIALVRRRDPPRNLHATPGGFVDVGETVEAATLREVKEETNLDLDHLEQFRIYSDPSRDMRRHTVSAAFRCRVKDASNMHRGDDAKGVDLIPIKEILNLHFAFDHRTILTDYLTKYHPQYLPSDASK